MRQDTWDALDALFSKHPVMRAEPVPRDEVDSAFADLRFPVVTDFRDFVRRYGGAIVGPYPIFGLRQAVAMGGEEVSFVAVTHNFRDQVWRGVDDWLVVSMDHAGNPIGISKDGRVWCSDHDAGEIVLVASTFEEFLRSKCLDLSVP